jgi:chorismate--pyruvate lyase
MTRPGGALQATGPLPPSRRLAAWLCIDGSLSARIAQAAGHLQVRVLRQGPVRLLAGEAARLGCPAGAHAHGREVLLLANGEPVVFARSVLQAVHARGTWKAIRGLGQHSLADLLFGMPATPRSGFEFTRFAPGSSVAVRVQRRWQEATGDAWGRREVWARCSVFARRGAPLLVTECFAPAIERLAAPQRARATPWRAASIALPSPTPRTPAQG